MSVVGVDFGTGSCVISQAKRGGIETVLNEASKRQTSALVSFKDETRFMGEQAVPLSSSNFKNTVKNLKRFIGKSWSDPSIQNEIELLPNAFAYKELDGDKIGIEVEFKEETMVFTPEELTAMLVGQLKATAEFANEGRPVADMVFSCPAYWTNRQRRALLDSCRIANIGLLGLINDGTAAALSYGIWKSASNQFQATEKEHVMFVDMGYTSFQVTIAAFVQGKLEIVSSACDANLGGRDVDMLLAEHFSEKFAAKHKMNPLSESKPTMKLLAGCEKAKKELTPDGVNIAKIHVEYIMEEIDFTSNLELETFEGLIAPLVARVVEPLEKAMEQSGLTMDKIHSVEIIGGAMRVRAFKKKVAETLGLDTTKLNYGLMTTQNADECVSRGTALMCAMLSPVFRVKEFKVVDQVPYGIKLSWEQKDSIPEDAMEEDGVDTAGENSIIIMEKGTQFPKSRRVTFRRKDAFQIFASYDDQSEADLPPGSDLDIAEFEISGMPSTQEDSPPRIRVDFKYDHSGVFEVDFAKYLQEIIPEKTAESKGDEAKVAEGDESKVVEGETEEKPKKTFKSIPLKVDVVYPFALTPEAIEKASRRENEFIAQDKVLRATSDKKNELEEYCYSMRDKVEGELREFATEGERTEIQGELEAVESWLYDEGYDEKLEVYVSKLKGLQDQGNKFVHRMHEHEERPKAAQSLKDDIGTYLGVVNSPDPKYDHISQEDRNKVVNACEDAEKWITTQMSKQVDKNLHEDPCITVGEIETSKNDLRYICKPIVSKKKPAPKKEEKKEEKTPEPETKEDETDAPNAEAIKKDNMDLD